MTTSGQISDWIENLGFFALLAFELALFQELDVKLLISFNAEVPRLVKQHKCNRFWNYEYFE